MKRAAAVLILLCAVLAIVLLCGRQPNPEYLRIHIRADSNAEEAQAVKYEVRDEIVRFLAPVLAECRTKQDAAEAIGGLLPEIEAHAEEVLSRAGFFYGAHASLRREEFPTRVYQGLTLEAGVYDALILELGSGKGDNWWCVVYPPLCFTSGGGNVVYRSKILEIVREFFK